jgi:hypothetical protein
VRIIATLLCALALVACSSAEQTPERAPVPEVSCTEHGAGQHTEYAECPREDHTHLPRSSSHSSELHRQMQAASAPRRVCRTLLGLAVGPEQNDGYDREAFGSYNREALLNATLYRHGDYYSLWDGRHYDDSAEVDVDHTVALAEAWGSGAHQWPGHRLGAFGGDSDNLTLLTDDLNQSKGDADPAEWLPPTHLQRYLRAWVKVKSEWDLSVDPIELVALTDLLECRP